MNIVVFDLETKLRPGQDCAWEDKHKMGVSVGCAFSYATGDLSVHLDDNLADLWDMLAKADLIAGYNIVEFDLPLIREEMLKLVAANGPREGVAEMNPVLKVVADQYRAMLAKAYDLYLEAKAGAKVDKFARGFKCDEVLRATFGAGAGKTGNGALAPDLYKAGKMGELISYCAADVARERRIFERCWNEGTLRTMGVGNGETWFPVRRPQEVLGYGAGELGPLPFRLDIDPCLEVALPLPAAAPTIPIQPPPPAYLPQKAAPASTASDDI